MNKQRTRIQNMASAKQMRSKIEANEYKDYILGFIFYKFFLNKVVELAIKEGYDRRTPTA